ncbi:hypothetical protein D3C87_1539920 [compost metagenome]
MHQRVGVLRFEVQRLAVKPLRLEGTAGDVAEQPQPIKHLGYRFVTAQIAVTGSAGLGTFAFVGQCGDVRQQYGSLRVGRSGHDR